jgi:hypothetical protein
MTVVISSLKVIVDPMFFRYTIQMIPVNPDQQGFRIIINHSDLWEPYYSRSVVTNLYQK